MKIKMALLRYILLLCRNGPFANSTKSEYFTNELICKLTSRKYLSGEKTFLCCVFKVIYIWTSILFKIDHWNSNIGGLILYSIRILFRLRFLLFWNSAEKINLGILRTDSAHTFSILHPHHVLSLYSLRSYVMKVTTLFCPQGVYGLIEELDKKSFERRRREVEAHINYKRYNYTVFLQVAVDFIILIILYFV